MARPAVALAVFRSGQPWEIVASRVGPFWWGPASRRTRKEALPLQLRELPESVKRQSLDAGGHLSFAVVWSKPCARWRLGILRAVVGGFGAAQRACNGASHAACDSLLSLANETN